MLGGSEFGEEWQTGKAECLGLHDILAAVIYSYVAELDHCLECSPRRHECRRRHSDLVGDTAGRRTHRVLHLRVEAEKELQNWHGPDSNLRCSPQPQPTSQRETKRKRRSEQGVCGRRAGFSEAVEGCEWTDHSCLASRIGSTSDSLLFHEPGASFQKNDTERIEDAV